VRAAASTERRRHPRSAPTARLRASESGVSELRGVGRGSETHKVRSLLKAPRGRPPRTRARRPSASTSAGLPAPRVAQRKAWCAMACAGIRGTARLREQRALAERRARQQRRHRLATAARRSVSAKRTGRSTSRPPHAAAEPLRRKESLYVRCRHGRRHQRAPSRRWSRGGRPAAAARPRRPVVDAMAPSTEASRYLL
jgi:hypothetical protein